MKCPLCENNNLKEIETINKEQLVNLYQKMTGIDFSYLIGENLDYIET